MQFALTLVTPEPAVLPFAQSRSAQALASLGAVAPAPRPLGPGALDLIFDAPAGSLDLLRQGARDAVYGLPVDAGVQPAVGRRKRLLISDMDATIVAVECIDELADFAGLKAEIAAITEAGMRGEMDFETGLRERVRMLTGLASRDIDRCIAERVTLNAGAETLVRTMAANGAECLLVSGGFTLFVEKVAADVGFHRSHSNVLEIAEGQLTGQVLGPVFGSAQKLATLMEEAERLGLELSETLAVGDGANDLAMIEAAGLGVAYRAKPVVAARADARVEHADLTALLYFQGYAAEEFA
jgi:phosphoserine phosphatase